MLNGQIPSTSQLQQEITRLFSIDRLDWMPNNMIVQGNTLELIDFDHPGSEPKTVKTQHMLNSVTKFVTEPLPQRIPSIFNEILLYCRQQLHPTFKIISKNITFLKKALLTKK